jgi:hypothetical protein
MSLRLNGSTSGYSEIDAPAVAGSNTLTLPGGNGSADQALVTNGSGTLSFADRGRMVLETAQSATGTEVDFTSIPSWVKRVTVMFNGVSSDGLSNFLVQVGNGGVLTTGYLGNCSNQNGATTSAFSAGFVVSVGNGAASTLSGQCAIALLSSNVYVETSVLADYSTAGALRTGSGSVSLGGTLDQVRITTVNGTDTFDAGTINLLLEG